MRSGDQAGSQTTSTKTSATPSHVPYLALHLERQRLRGRAAGRRQGHPDLDAALTVDVDAVDEAQLPDVHGDLRVVHRADGVDDAGTQREGEHRDRSSCGQPPLSSIPAAWRRAGDRARPGRARGRSGSSRRRRTPSRAWPSHRRGRCHAPAGRTAHPGSTVPTVAPCVHLTSLAKISSCGLVLTCASSESSSVLFVCFASVFCASGRTRIRPLNTPRARPPRMPL